MLLLRAFYISICYLLLSPLFPIFLKISGNIKTNLKLKKSLKSMKIIKSLKIIFNHINDAEKCMPDLVLILPDLQNHRNSDLLMILKAVLYILFEIHVFIFLLIQNIKKNIYNISGGVPASQTFVFILCVLLLCFVYFLKTYKTKRESKTKHI